MAIRLFGRLEMAFIACMHAGFGSKIDTIRIGSNAREKGNRLGGTEKGLHLGGR